MRRYKGRQRRNRVRRMDRTDHGRAKREPRKLRRAGSSVRATAATAVWVGHPTPSCRYRRDGVACRRDVPGAHLRGYMKTALAARRRAGPLHASPDDLSSTMRTGPRRRARVHSTVTSFTTAPGAPPTRHPRAAASPGDNGGAVRRTGPRAHPTRSPSRHDDDHAPKQRRRRRRRPAQHSPPVRPHWVADGRWRAKARHLSGLRARPSTHRGA